MKHAPWVWHICSPASPVLLAPLSLHSTLLTSILSSFKSPHPHPIFLPTRWLCFLHLHPDCSSGDLLPHLSSFPSHLTLELPAPTIPGSLSRFPIGFIPTLTLSISPNSLHFWTHQLLPLAPFQMHHMKTQLANPKISMYSVRRSCNNTPKQASKKEYEGISSQSLRWQMRDVRILSATKQIAKFQLKSLHIRSKIKKKKQTAALPSFGVSILQAFRASASATPSNNGSGTLLHYSEGPTSTRAKPLFI